MTGWDAVVFVVGNATQTAHYYQSRLGHGAGRLLRAGDRQPRPQVVRAEVRLDPVRPQGRGRPRQPAARPPRRHGDGVVDIALEVPDVDRCIAHARRAGATVLEEPHDVSDEHGTVRIAAIATYGETRHTLVAVDGAYTGPYLPGYVAAASTFVKREGAPKRLFQALDHVVGNVELGQMDEWVEFYNRVMGFVNMAEFVGDDIATEYSALMSKVVANGNHRVKFPLNEPAIAAAQEPDRRVPRVLRRPRRPAPRAGDQRHPGHRRRAARRGCRVPRHPRLLLRRPGAAGADRRGAGADRGAEVARILVDRDEDGYLLQIFTKPLGDRPTVFFELIERHGSLGFGKGNFKALFESIEREQERRGNL